MGWYYNKTDAKRIWKSLILKCEPDEQGNSQMEICEEWKNYYNFERWFLENVYATKQYHLGICSDLLIWDAKIYSPETCCLLPLSFINLVYSCKSRNQFLPGVSIAKAGTFHTKLAKGSGVLAKTFKTEKEAFYFYKEYKEQLIKNKATASKPLFPEHIYKALMSLEVKPIRGTYNNLFGMQSEVLYSNQSEV